nr:hypothetical protein [uncultured Flavobacterium sp.]
MMKKLIMSIVFIGCFMSSYSQKDVKFNLYDLFQSSKLTIQNRKLVAIDSLSRKYVRVSENGKEGIIWLPIHDFKKGVVKIEMRGKDVLQESFIGVVFHGQDDMTYDAVYCRPFNFLAKDSVRRIHAIQYISHPTYTWKKLREERNGAFEKEIKNPPNPNGWFTMTLVVENKVIKAYINDSEVPSLEVEKLTNIQSGKLGIFVGDGSGGDFENIFIKME